MLPHFGQLMILPIAALLRTLSRASQVVQTMEKSASATVSVTRAGRAPSASVVLQVYQL